MIFHPHAQTSPLRNVILIIHEQWTLYESFVLVILEQVLISLYILYHLCYQINVPLCVFKIENTLWESFYWINYQPTALLTFAKWCNKKYLTLSSNFSLSVTKKGFSNLFFLFKLWSSSKIYIYSFDISHVRRRSNDQVIVQSCHLWLIQKMHSIFLLWRGKFVRRQLSKALYTHLTIWRQNMTRFDIN